MAKPRTTKTLGPLHFEDLEPHRFESLVRNLLYDFRYWLKIEPTGQAGSDDGFDIRAWEKTEEISNTGERKKYEEDDQKGTRTIKSNLWKIQCKRENKIGPSRVGEIISETVKEKDSLYGYILAAPAVFSKKSYDIFREKLREKGVVEFYIWGRLELEDMLHMPKNDRILFSFFGFSLATQKRAKTSEIKFLLNNKNKLFRILKGQQRNDFRESILIRDFNDTNYPYRDKYKDFHEKPKWKEYVAYSYHPLGLWIHISKWFAFIDKLRKEFDFTKSVDLLRRESETGYRRDPDKENLKELAENFWTHLPLNNQAHIEVDGLILYENMLIIDDKGDILYPFPHIFVNYKINNGPLSYYRYRLEGEDKEQINPTDGKYERKKIFPKKFNKLKLNKIHKDKQIEWDEQTLRSFTGTYPRTGRIFDMRGKYKYLKKRDVISVKNPKKPYEGDTNDKYYLEITNIFSTTVYQFLKENGKHFKNMIEKQVGGKVKGKNKLVVLEYVEIYDWKIKELTGSSPAN